MIFFKIFNQMDVNFAKQSTKPTENLTTATTMKNNGYCLRNYHNLTHNHLYLTTCMSMYITH